MSKEAHYHRMKAILEKAEKGDDIPNDLAKTFQNDLNLCIENVYANPNSEWDKKLLSECYCIRGNLLSSQYPSLFVK